MLPHQLLLLSTDQKVIRTLQPTWLTFAGTHLIVCADAQSAIRMFNKRRIDALIFDAEIPDAFSALLVPAIEKQCCVTFGISKADQPMSVQFVLRKPISAEYAMRSFRAASGLMKRARKQYHRHDVDLPISLYFDNFQAHGNLNNISKGGMAIRVRERLEVGARTRFLFQLSPVNDISGDGNIVWSVQGKVGIRFRAINPNSVGALEQWFGRQPG